MEIEQFVRGISRQCGKKAGGRNVNITFQTELG
jgi:hypothetical protein